MQVHPSSMNLAHGPPIFTIPYKQRLLTSACTCMLDCGLVSLCDFTCTFVIIIASNIAYVDERLSTAVFNMIPLSFLEGFFLSYRALMFFSFFTCRWILRKILLRKIKCDIVNERLQSWKLIENQNNWNVTVN